MNWITETMLQQHLKTFYCYKDKEKKNTLCITSLKKTLQFLCVEAYNLKRQDRIFCNVRFLTNHMKIIRREKLASEKGSTLSLRPAENKKHNSKIKKKKKQSIILHRVFIQPVSKTTTTTTTESKTPRLSILSKHTTLLGHILLQFQFSFNLKFDKGVLFVHCVPDYGNKLGMSGNRNETG